MLITNLESMAQEIEALVYRKIPDKDDLHTLHDLFDHADAGLEELNQFQSENGESEDQREAINRMEASIIRFRVQYYRHKLEIEDYKSLFRLEKV